MKKTIILFHFVIFFFLTNHVIGEEKPYPEVPRISPILAYEKYKTGKAILIDAMGPETFSKKRALGSINIPNDGPEDRVRAREMPLPFYPEQEIIVYCD